MTKKLLGIDEAGRGPVLGPLVIAGVMIQEHQQDELRSWGVKDSKLLQPYKREALAERIMNTFPYKIIIIQPAEIDAALESETLNLNWLEAHKTAEIINELKPDIALIDSPSPNIPAYRKYIERLLTHDAIITPEHKADLNYPVVGAASIIAKVTRDAEIQKLQKDIPVPLGSGYMSDPLTQQFLAKYHDAYPYIIRKSWASYRNLIDKKVQKGIGDF